MLGSLLGTLHIFHSVTVSLLQFPQLHLIAQRGRESDLCLASRQANPRVRTLCKEYGLMGSRCPRQLLPEEDALLLSLILGSQGSKGMLDSKGSS